MKGSFSTLCRLELLNTEGVLATNKKYNTTLKPRPTLFLEYRSTHSSIEACLVDARDAESRMKEFSARDYTFADNGDVLDELWEARRGYELIFDLAHFVHF